MNNVTYKEMNSLYQVPNVNGIKPAISTSIPINPSFVELSSPESIKTHINHLTSSIKPKQPKEILQMLLCQFKSLDFEAMAFPEFIELREKLETLTPESEEKRNIKKELSKLKVGTKHYLILSIENIRNVAHKNKWGLCKNQDFIYLYNGAYWSLIEEDLLTKFLGEAAERMGVNVFSSRHYQFREQLLKQFLSAEYLPTSESTDDTVQINLLNGTFEITPSSMNLRQFASEDFMTYQLPFHYDKEAIAPVFQSYLDRVLPDKQRQIVMAEYLGYVFIRHGSQTIKEEKALVLYGSGANGKSVFFEVINALLGNENVSSYSLQSLTDSSGYYRAMIANKLVNYASEISGNLETATFKQLVSGEPIEARLPYGNPMTIRQYARLIFNSNELPKDVEHTNAYFRRFLIIPFDVTIPEEEQDKQLHKKIINNELSGVFNWVLEGLNRLLLQKHFSPCDAAMDALEQYKKDSDTVQSFLDECNYKGTASSSKLLKILYNEYRVFCQEGGFKPLNKINFNKRLKALGIIIERKNNGYVVFVDSENDPF
jgi:putative DNA primase/helicase